LTLTKQPFLAPVLWFPSIAIVLFSQIHKRWIDMSSRIIAFWFIWIVPFVSLIFIAVGLVGFLSLRNGQKAVNELAEQLLTRTNQLVTQHLESYLTASKNLVRLDAAALENGTLD
jgi:hypothetical protein